MALTSNRSYAQNVSSIYDVAEDNVPKVNRRRRSSVYAVLYVESVRSFLFKRNTDVELDLSNALLHTRLLFGVVVQAVVGQNY